MARRAPGRARAGGEAEAFGTGSGSAASIAIARGRARAPARPGGAEVSAVPRGHPGPRSRCRGAQPRACPRASGSSERPGRARALRGTEGAGKAFGVGLGPARPGPGQQVRSARARHGTARPGLARGAARRLRPGPLRRGSRSVWPRLVAALVKGAEGRAAGVAMARRQARVSFVAPLRYGLDSGGCVSRALLPPHPPRDLGLRSLDAGSIGAPGKV